MNHTRIPLPEVSRLSALHTLSWYESLDLRKHYKIGFEFRLQRSSIPLSCAVLLWSGVVTHKLAGPFSGQGELERTALLVGAIAATLTTLASIVFWDIYRRNIEITLEGLRLNYTRGLLRKSTGSLVLRSHNVVQLFQRPLDRLFGVWELQIYGSNQPNVDFALIPGLSYEDGYDLLRFFTQELSKQISVQDRDDEE